ncbi:MAG: hypothetical protein COX70_03750 [Flavobacteriales bacterium CG_4_10_14_0_2_um_filter_32_8]|nr:MAG: hypothetical protein COX70_03750 [Flavobacteriales bacterium CG_4_10_14_0_2_um_filter_32_8]PJB13825.1 MAG: hypothetical protein CO118_11810 [Flavobacteriales bacterium CG_4_9_14_3_um_filter_32_8]
MQFLKNHISWVICILSFFSAFFYNQLNLQQLPKDKIRDNQTVITNDDVSYLVPPENYLISGVWKDNSIGKQSYFIRPPGYGIFYMVFLKIAGYPLALKWLKIAQLLLFSISIYWLYRIAFSLLKHNKMALFVAALYGLTPFASGFLFYTLTEGVTPALLLLFVFLLFKAYEITSTKQKNCYYFLAALTFSYLLLVRPPLGFMGILIPIFLVKEYWETRKIKTMIQLFLFGIIAFSFTAIWQVRNYKITNEWVGLHPIYYSEGNSMYRPTLKEYWNFVGGWAQEGQEAHSYLVPMWQAAIKGDTSFVYINNAIQTFPKEVVSFFGEQRLVAVFRKYQQATLFQKPYYEKRLPMPKETPAIEQEVIQEFKQLTKEYKSEFWMNYHFIAPLKVFKTMAFHSNLSLYIFQQTYRGNVAMDAIRLTFFAIHSLCFIFLLFNLIFIKKTDWRQTALAISVFSYVFYLCYFQRGIEERYTLPILPLLLLGMVAISQQLITRLRRLS